MEPLAEVGLSNLRFRARDAQRPRFDSANQARSLVAYLLSIGTQNGEKTIQHLQGKDGPSKLSTRPQNQTAILF
jgi:hypothetical protein